MDLAPLPADVLAVLEPVREAIMADARKLAHAQLTDDIQKAISYGGFVANERDKAEGVRIALEAVGIRLDDITREVGDNEDDEYECTVGSMCCGYCSECETHHEDCGDSVDRHTIYGRNGHQPVCTECRHFCEEF